MGKIKLILGCCIALLAVLLLCSCAEQASNGLLYESAGNGECVVTGIGECTDTELYIPSKSPAGERVVAVADWAFANNKDLVAVVLPGSVTKIGASAFQGCIALETVTLAEGNAEIGVNAFYSCNSLKQVKTAGKTANLALQAQLGGGIITKELQLVMFPDSMRRVESGAFGDCERLQEMVILQDSLELVDDGAFANCAALKFIYVYSGVDRMGADVFRGCEDLFIGTAAKEAQEGWDARWMYASFSNTHTTVYETAFRSYLSEMGQRVNFFS